MQISFSPMRRGDTLMLSKSGDVLTINDEAFDFSGLPDGATLPREAVTCEWLASDVERIDGVIHLTLILPHGAQAPAETLFPALTIATDGDIAVPAHCAEPELEDVE
jgi:hypothetical protein